MAKFDNMFKRAEEVENDESGEILSPETDELVSAIQTAEEDAGEVEESMGEGDEIEETIDAVEALIAVAKGDGLCRGVMAVADPSGALGGRFPALALENFGAVPSQDSANTAALESLVDSIKKAAEAVIKWFKDLWEKLVAWAKSLLNVWLRLERALNGLKAKLKDLKDLDAKKLGEKKVKVPKASDLTDGLNFSRKQATQGSLFNEDNKKYVSLLSKFDAPEEADDLKALGYDLAKARSIVDVALEVCGVFKNAKTMLKEVEDRGKNLETKAKKAIADAQKDEDRTAANEQLKTARADASLAVNNVTKVQAAAQKLVRFAITAGGAVASCASK